MKVGDLVKLPQDQGYAILYDLVIDKRIDNVMAIVLREWGLDYWDASSCEVISEAR